MTTTFQIGDTAIFPGNIRSTVTRIHQSHGTTWITDSEGFATEADTVRPVSASADSRIRTADAALEAAYAALRIKGRTRPQPGAHHAITWGAETLELLTAATNALIELVDAKEAAGRMSKRKADSLRTQARAKQAATERVHNAATTQTLRTACSH